MNQLENPLRRDKSTKRLFGGRPKEDDFGLDLNKADIDQDLNDLTYDYNGVHLNLDWYRFAQALEEIFKEKESRGETISFERVAKPYTPIKLVKTILGRKIEENGRAVSLKFDELVITNDDAIKLKPFIDKLKISKLFFYDNDTSAKAISTITEGSMSTGLEWLIVEGRARRFSELGQEIGEQLPGSKLIKLMLKNCSIGDSGLIAISKSLPKSELQMLALSSNSISADGVRALADVLPRTKLETIYLDKNTISNIGAIDLAKTIKSSKLRVLYLADNAIGNQGTIALLKALPSTMTDLDLSDNEITDAIFSTLLPIFKNTSLKEINLLGNNFSEFEREVLRSRANEAGIKITI